MNDPLPIMNKGLLKQERGTGGIRPLTFLRETFVVKRVLIVPLPVSKKGKMISVYGMYDCTVVKEKSNHSFILPEDFCIKM